MTRSTLKTAKTAFWDTFLVNNIVLVQAAGICPILAIGYDLQFGVTLSLCTTAVLLPVNLCFILFGNRFTPWLRSVLYTVFSSILLFVAALLLRHLSAELYAHLYVFLPLMAVNTLFTYRVSTFQTTPHPLVAVADSLGTALGFSLVMCITCTLREMAINGTIWGLPLGYEARFPEAQHPFIGFVLLGFMSAALQWIKQLSSRFLRKEETP